MFFSYFKTAWRSLTRNRLFSAINIVGLLAGLCACLLIGIFLLHEYSYDRFNTNGHRIYRMTMQYGSGGTDNAAATTGTKAGPEIKRRFAAVEEYCRTYRAERALKLGDRRFGNEDMLYADPSFFRMFSFPLLQGDVNSALDGPDRIVLSASTATKIFGGVDVVGRTITLRDKPYTVTGVAKDAPSASQIHFDAVTAFTNLGQQVQEEIWFTANWVTYVMLKPGQDGSTLQNAFNDWLAGPDGRTSTGMEGTDYLRYKLEPLFSVHLHSHLSGFEPNGNPTLLAILAAMAVLILLIAASNYTNLATAQSATRTAEIGVRKVMGATRGRIFSQFLSEAVLLTLLATGGALLVAYLLLPAFSGISGRNFTGHDLLNPVLLAGLVVVSMLLALVSGSYPAMMVSGTPVISVMKKGFSFTGGKGGLRRALILLQFGISVFLIIMTMVIGRQLNYVRTKSLGYDREQVLVMPVDARVGKDYEAIKRSFAQVPGVMGITGAYETPEYIQWSDGLRTTDEKGPHEISVNALPTDLGLTSTLKIDLAAGRDFQESDLVMNDTTGGTLHAKPVYILNESAVRKLGWTAASAIGRIVDRGEPGEVVGVVRDFHFESLHEPIKPLVIFPDRDMVQQWMVRIAPGSTEKTLSGLMAVWKERIPYRPFDHHFLDEDYNKLYQDEQRTAQVFLWAAVLAIILACLGLFGLAAFTTTQRSREIAIRRVLGAGTARIAWLVAGNFLRLVVIASIIVIPISAYASAQWLRDFAYRVAVPWWIYPLAGIVALVIALLGIGLPVHRITSLRPAQTIRSKD